MMEVSVDIVINASKEAVWKVITDIDAAKDNITAINSIEVLERPDSGLVGLKWKETRTMFGKEASEVMWITDSEENVTYRTRAESHGSIYVSWHKLEEVEAGVKYTMGFSGKAQSMGAKIMNGLMGWMMKSSTKKALMKDLEDIKAVAEAA